MTTLRCTATLGIMGYGSWLNGGIGHNRSSMIEAAYSPMPRPRCRKQRMKSVVELDIKVQQARIAELFSDTKRNPE
jgi:hypothetical protein